MASNNLPYRMFNLIVSCSELVFAKTTDIFPLRLCTNLADLCSFLALFSLATNSL